MKKLKWDEMKAICKSCPKSASDNLPYAIWWSYCQTHCKLYGEFKKEEVSSD